MKQLIAVLPILHESVNYKPGDELPTHNAELVKIWIGSGAAIWKKEEKEKAVKASPASAPPGLAGDAYPSSGPGQDLIGKPPDRKTRGAQPEPSKGRRKSSA